MIGYSLKPILQQLSIRIFTLWFGLFAFLSFDVFSSPADTYLEFDGGNDFVEIPDADDLDLTGSQFTLSLWVKPSDWGNNDQGRILDHGGGSVSAGWTLQVENKGSRGYPQALRLQINNDSSFDGLSDDNAITLDIWQHVAVTYNTGILTFYVDGIERGVRTGVPEPLAASLPVRIGMRATDTKRNFEGAMDDVQIWNRVLTQVEIIDNMNVELNGSEAGLVAYYPFNEGAGQNVLDQTGKGHLGILGNSDIVSDDDPVWVSSVPLVNQAPVVNAGENQTLVLPSTTTTLNATVIDDDFPGYPLSTSWSVVSGPGSVTFADPGLLNTSVTFSEEGVYVLRMTADDTELSDSGEVSVAIEAEAILTNLLISPSSVNLAPSEFQKFSIYATDQSGAPMESSPAWTATGGIIDASGGYTAGTEVGLYSVTATDGEKSVLANITIQDISISWPTNGWVSSTPAEVGMNPALLADAASYAGGSGMISRGGYAVLTWGDINQRYDVKSVTKSIGSSALGLAVTDSLVNMTDLAQQYLPDIGTPPIANSLPGWLDSVSLQHLATHTAGFDKSGGYIEQLYAPGSTWAYSDGGANWLADVLTVIYGEDLKNLLFNRVFTALGLTSTDLVWRNNQYRDDLIQGITRREFGAGISANVDALARVGYLYLRGGQWDGQEIIMQDYVNQLRTTVPDITSLPVNNDTNSKFANASDHYGLMWWNNADGSMVNIPTDAFWAWGIGDSIILVIPSLDVIAVRAGGLAWAGSRTPSYYNVLTPFFEPIALSITSELSNQAPVVNAGENQTLVLPSTTTTLNATVIDDDFPGYPLSTSWSVVSGPGSVTFADPSLLNTSVTFSEEGVYVLRLTADDTALSDSDEVAITIESILPPDTTDPTVALTNPITGDIVAGIIVVSADASDSSGIATVEFFLHSTSLGSTSSLPYTISWDTTSVIDGDYTLTVVATDVAGNSASTGISLTVENSGPPVNSPPLVDVGLDQVITSPTNEAFLDATVTDDGLPSLALSYEWTIVSGPGGVTFASPASVDTSATFAAEGVYVLRLAANDTLLSGSDDITVTVQAVPVLDEINVSPGLVNVKVDGTVNFTASGVDQYGQDFALSPFWTATGGSIDATGQYTAGASMGSFTITASDGSVTGEAIVTITDSIPTQSYLEFDGSNDFVELPDADDLDLTGSQFTLSLWIKPSDWGNSDQGRMLDHGGGSVSAGWTLQVENKGSRGYPQALRLQINNDSSFNGLSDDNAIALDVWQHVAVTYNTGILTFYVDGIERGVRTGVPAALPASLPVRIGMRATDTKRTFEGAMDDVQIWNRALTQSEIVDNMNIELSGSESGLIAYYPFNEGAGQTVLDQTGKGHLGTLGISAVASDDDPAWVSSEP